MSGLSFSERVKLLLQKRLDATKWPIGDSGQGPGAIRYLSDGQGNAIALLTTSINPNDPEPIGPGSAEAAGETDPIITLHEEIQIPYTATKETGIVPFSAFVSDTSANTVMTFESPADTDFSIPSGKTGRITKLVWTHGTAGMYLSIGYGDDGVEAGTTEPTNPVHIAGGLAGLESPFVSPVADTKVEARVNLTIPDGKFPFARWPTTNAVKVAHIFGYSRDT